MQLVIQAFLFLSPRSQKRYSSGDARLNWPVLIKCTKVGAPDGLAIGFELGMWGAFYCLMSGLSVVHIMVASIAQTVILLFIWFGVGLEQGLGALSGNLIGEGRQDQLPAVMRSSNIISLAFAAGTAVIIWALGDQLVELLLQNPETLEGVENVRALTPEQIDACRATSRHGLFAVWLYLAIETFRMPAQGLLRGAGDTLYLMLASSLSILLFQVLPTYVFMVQWGMPVETLYSIWLGYSVIIWAVLYGRYRLHTCRKSAMILSS